MKRTLLFALLASLVVLLASCNLDPVKDQQYSYITFSSDATFTITPSYNGNKPVWDGTLQYSTVLNNPEAWVSFNPKKNPSATAGQSGDDYVLYVRGVDNTMVSSFGNGWTIQSTDDISCTGNIMSLLNCLDVNAATMGTDCFASMFEGWTNLVAAPLLPATTLTSGCYRSMFKNCSNLLVEEIPSGSYPTKWWGEWIFQVPSNAPADATTDMFTGISTDSVLVNQSVTAGSVYRSFLAEEPAKNFLTFSSDSQFSLQTPGPWWGTIQYSTNLFSVGGGWTNDTTRDYIPAQYNEETGKYVVYVRGKGHGQSGWLLNFGSTGTAKIDCNGNVMCLLDYEDMDGVSITAGCFHSLFEEFSNLRTAPELPATDLAPHCYDNMFFRCYSLESAPELPALTVPERAYNTMFGDCTSLADVHDLPATVLGEYAYNGMFYNCTALVNPPAIMATELAEGCCDCMFMWCKNMTVAPNLPATVMAKKCYFMMFDDCSSLTSAPDLFVTELAEECFGGMFQDCTSLKLEEVAPGSSPTKADAHLFFTAPTSSADVEDYCDFMFLRNSSDSVKHSNYDRYPLAGYSYYCF